MSCLNENNCTKEVYFEKIVQIDNIDTGSWYFILNVGMKGKSKQSVKFKFDTGAVLSV